MPVYIEMFLHSNKYGSQQHAYSDPKRHKFTHEKQFLAQGFDIHETSRH